MIDKINKFNEAHSLPLINGSDVTKLKPTVYVMKLEDLDEWVKTRAQIGDIAYCHDHISDHHYIYCYRKPDDKPIWNMIPDFLEKYSKKEDKKDDKMNVNEICPYKTPCGWCVKWDKKCDKKIELVMRSPKED